MLRTNLATRPFYNERLAHLALAALAVLVLAITGFNVNRILMLSQRNTTLKLAADRDEQQAARLDQQSNEVRRGLDTKELNTVAAAAREANVLIDQRTFSWTELFNRIEATLPADVMITSVRPQIRDGVITVSLVVVGRRVEDIDAFMESLEKTGAFTGLLSRQEEATEDGMYRAVLQGQYRGRL
jgi:hypothetical protein